MCLDRFFSPARPEDPKYTKKTFRTSAKSTKINIKVTAQERLNHEVREEHEEEKEKKKETDMLTQKRHN